MMEDNFPGSEDAYLDGILNKKPTDGSYNMFPEKIEEEEEKEEAPSQKTPISDTATSSDKQEIEETEETPSKITLKMKKIFENDSEEAFKKLEEISSKRDQQNSDIIHINLEHFDIKEKDGKDQIIEKLKPILDPIIDIIKNQNMIGLIMESTKAHKDKYQDVLKEIKERYKFERILIHYMKDTEKDYFDKLFNLDHVIRIVYSDKPNKVVIKYCVSIPLRKKGITRDVL